MTTTKRLIWQVGVLTALALPAAAQAPDVAAANRPQTAGEGVAMLSGGVGETAKAQMKQAANDYNVHLVFSNRRGEYLANVPFAVSDLRGRQVVAGTSEGPLLYLRLPPGRYDVSAQVGGTSVTRRIQAAADGRGAEINLIGDER